MRRFNAIGWTAVAVVLIAAAVGATFMVRAATAGPTITEAFETCGEVGLVEDDGATIILEGYGDTLTELVGEDDELHDAMTTLGLASTEDQACVLNELEVPMSVASHMSSTRALDGTQTDSWDGYEASWTYHPDDGLNLTVTEAE